MSTRIHTNTFDSREDAEAAQKEARCAGCGNRLKLNKLHGKWALTSCSLDSQRRRQRKRKAPTKRGWETIR